MNPKNAKHRQNLTLERAALWKLLLARVGIGRIVMPKEDLWAKAREFRKFAKTCGDLVVYRALLELADACEELAEQEAIEDAPTAGPEEDG